MKQCPINPLAVIFVQMSLCQYRAAVGHTQMVHAVDVRGSGRGADALDIVAVRWISGPVLGNGAGFW